MTKLEGVSSKKTKVIQLVCTFIGTFVLASIGLCFYDSESRIEVAGESFTITKMKKTEGGLLKTTELVFTHSGETLLVENGKWSAVEVYKYSSAERVTEFQYSVDTKRGLGAEFVTVKGQVTFPAINAENVKILFSDYKKIDNVFHPFENYLHKEIKEVVKKNYLVLKDIVQNKAKLEDFDAIFSHVADKINSLLAIKGIVIETVSVNEMESDELKPSFEEGERLSITKANKGFSWKIFWRNLPISLLLAFVACIAMFSPVLFGLLKAAARG